jgi:type I restriction enzyme R subunit
VGNNLSELINSNGLEKLATLEKGVNTVYSNDETKRKIQILAREVFKKYKALQPDKLLNQYVSRKNSIDIIYNYYPTN